MMSLVGEGDKASVITTVTRNHLDGDIKSVVAINMMITVEGGEEVIVILLMRSLLDVIKEGVGFLMLINRLVFSNLR